MTALKRAILGAVKNGANNRLAVLSEVIYIIWQIWTTKGGSIKRCELLTELYCNL